MDADPALPLAEEWNLLDKLKAEKEVAGTYLTAHPLDDFATEITSFTNITIDEINNFEGNKEQMNLILAGFVAVAEHKISKKATGWGTFELQDYSGNCRFSLYSENYIKFKNHLEAGQRLLVKASYRFSNFHNKMEFNVNEIHLLADVAEKMSKSIHLHLNHEAITPDTIEALEKILKECKGNQHVFVSISNVENEPTLVFTMPNDKVSISQRLRDALDAQNISYSLN